MSIRLFALVLLASLSTITPAAAGQVSNVEVFFVLAIAGVVLVAIIAFAAWLVGKFMDEFFPEPPPPRPMTADEINEEARRIRARAQRLQAETDLKRHEIERARIDAAHREITQITDHDRKVRALKRNASLP